MTLGPCKQLPRLPPHNRSRRELRGGPAVVMTIIAMRGLAETALGVAVLTVQFPMSFIELKAGHRMAKVLRIPAAMAGIA